MVVRALQTDELLYAVNLRCYATFSEEENADERR